MPIITVDWYEGRSDEVKRELAEKLTDLMVEVGQARRESVWIRFNDTPKRDWAIGGRKND